MERRLIIEWKSGQMWHQKSLAKSILEVRPPGFIREFTGYMDFTLSFRELKAIVGSDSGGGDPVWCHRLSSVSGVYFVLSDEGPTYVGSASGRGEEGGFLGRWRTYASTNDEATGEGDEVGLRGNVGLKEFLYAGGDKALQRKRLQGLRFSIAHVMDKNAKRQDVLDMEGWFKEKLRSRSVEMSLNRN